MVMYAEKPFSTEEPQERVGLAPALPYVTSRVEALGKDASPTLDAMIAYMRKWATRSYDGYFEGVALWTLSTIAARRVYLPWSTGVWTNLYVVLVSESTVSAKTKAASYGLKIIEDCGLSYLMAPDEITPQKLISKMSGINTTVPRNYSVMTAEQKETFKKKLAFSGQKGWLYDEFGDMLQEMIKGNGSSSMFYKILKKLYDNKREYGYDTRTWGEETVDMPYLSLLGTTPPSSLMPIASPTSAVWNDGAFARMAWIVAPLNKPQLTSAPEGEATVPDEIIRKLQYWHNRLGEPTCNIEEKESDDGKKTDYTITRTPLPQNDVYWHDSGVREAHEKYYAALVMIASEYQLDGRYKSTYGRLPDTALRIAMLLASLENDNRMTIEHWGRAQSITERWRNDFHELVAQIASGYEDESYGATEQAIIEVIEKRFKPGERFTCRHIVECGSRILRKIGVKEIRRVLDELAMANTEMKTGQIGREGNGPSAKYWIFVQDEQTKG